jgi:hypothetical protein
MLTACLVKVSRCGSDGIHTVSDPLTSRRDVLSPLVRVPIFPSPQAMEARMLVSNRTLLLVPHRRARMFTAPCFYQEGRRPVLPHRAAFLSRNLWLRKSLFRASNSPPVHLSAQPDNNTCTGSNSGPKALCRWPLEFFRLHNDSYAPSSFESTDGSGHYRKCRLGDETRCDCSCPNRTALRHCLSLDSQVFQLQHGGEPILVPTPTKVMQ